jgi:predicted translin family RNA/ssDNA-binding protein
MENLCSVTQDLNRRDEENTIYNLELDSFFDRISAELETIEETIKELKELASDYNDYDFTEELTSELKEILS